MRGTKMAYPGINFFDVAEKDLKLHGGEWLHITFPQELSDVALILVK